MSFQSVIKEARCKMPHDSVHMKSQEEANHRDRKERRGCRGQGASPNTYGVSFWGGENVLELVTVAQLCEYVRRH